MCLFSSSGCFLLVTCLLDLMIIILVNLLYDSVIWQVIGAVIPTLPLSWFFSLFSCSNFGWAAQGSIGCLCRPTKWVCNSALLNCVMLILFCNHLPQTMCTEEELGLLKKLVIKNKIAIIHIIPEAFLITDWLCFRLAILIGHRLIISGTSSNLEYYSIGSKVSGVSLCWLVFLWICKKTL
jgi:hypothetical protein